MADVSKLGKIATKRPFTTMGFLYYIKKIIFAIWIFAILFSISQAYLDSNIPGVFDYLGSELATPTFEINNQSLQIIEQGGTYNSYEDSFWKNIWNMLNTYWGLFFSLLSIIIWFNLIKWFVTIVYTGDTSRITSNYLISITLFLLIQIIFIAFFHPELGLEGMKIPFIAFVNLIKSIPYLIPFI